MPHHKHLHIQKFRKSKIVNVISSFVLASLFTFYFATILGSFGMAIEVVIPSSAPIWIGSLNIIYKIQDK